jgi:short-subunit dehydrogenase
MIVFYFFYFILTMFQEKIKEKGGGFVKHVVITGAGSGLGKALAKRYAHEGYSIYLLGRNEQKLLQVNNEISDTGGEANSIVCDVADESSIIKAVEQFKQADVLINNAGVGHFGPLEAYSTQEMNEMLNTNIKGTILMTQAILPLLKRNGGRILNVISTAGLRGKANESIYCASKFAQAGFTKSLQQEFKDKNIAVTAVYMGGMNTPFWEASDHAQNPDAFMDPEQVADAIFQQDDGRLEIVIERKK